MTTKKDKPASIQKEYRKVSQLKNWDKNPRNIKEKDFERLKTQIRDLKQYKPLLITEDGIVLGGNMRLRAYRDLGIEDVWVSVVDAPDEEAKMRYALSDNDRAGFYDEDLLANLTGEYPDFNWEDYAVDLKEPQTLDDLIKSLTPVEEDDVPEVSDEPARSEYGKVYQLGRHRLMCGDATKIEDVEKLMDGKKADLVLTDPPYGIDYGGMLKGKGDGEGGADKNGWKSYDIPEWDKQRPNKDWLTNVQVFSDNLIIWGGNYFTDILKPSMGWLIWDKGQREFSLADGEMAWTSFNSALRIKTISRGEALQDGKVHPTQKSLEIMIWSIDYASRCTKLEINTILDVFGGSGSTLIACEQTNRTCCMMELDPKYCDVIRKRYENFTKK